MFPDFGLFLSHNFQHSSYRGTAEGPIKVGSFLYKIVQDLFKIMLNWKIKIDTNKN